MIIKFDHISYIAKKGEKENILNRISIPASFFEIGLSNLDIKNWIMKNPQQTHDLYYYDLEYPIEYIFYDKVNQFFNKGVVLRDNVIYGKYSDYDKAVSFLQCVFGGEKLKQNEDSIECNMKGILDKKNYPLVLYKAEESVGVYLDDPGFGVIALITSTRFKKQFEGGICTKCEPLTVNGKNLDICFVRSEYVNLIFEMIYVHK